MRLLRWGTFKKHIFPPELRGCEVRFVHVPLSKLHLHIDQEGLHHRYSRFRTATGKELIACDFAFGTDGEVLRMRDEHLAVVPQLAWIKRQAAFALSECEDTTPIIYIITNDHKPRHVAIVLHEGNLSIYGDDVALREGAS